MKIYILRAYADERKWQANAWIIGYFTSKAALWQTIKRRADELGLYNEQDAQHAFWWNCPESVSQWLDTGNIDAYTANECLE